MKSKLLAACAAAALSCALASPIAAADAPPTAAEAKAFVDAAEADLAALSEYGAHAGWVQATYINADSNWLAAKANAENTEAAVKYAKQAARFDHVEVDPVTRRKLYLLEQAVVLPAPARAGAAKELADLQADLDTLYSTGKFTYQGKTLTLDDMQDILRTSRDPAETKALWEGWRTVSPKMKDDYVKLVALANQGSKALGYADTGALWRSWYDMPPDRFGGEMDRLWGQVAPLYKSLHCYVRGRLNERYGDAVQPRTGPIRADLTGNMWGQAWGDIYDIVQPKGGTGLGYDLTANLVKQGYDATRIVKTGEGWYQSLGFAPLPQTFWERSMITRPRDREVVCHPSAWDVDNKDDLRIKACFTVTADDFYTAHHELGHNMYQRAYADQPFLFKGGANDGFHEAIGDFAGLNALTPDYLKQVGLIDTVPGTDADIPYLLKIALDKVAILPFAYLVDKWRWEVFSGQVTPDHYNDAWWDLVRKYQGMAPPAPRPADAFDPGAKFHVADNTPYARYFLADIYEFQFYRAACRQAGWKGPLNRCSVYGNKAVGEKFAAMLKLGQSRPWPEALKTFTGEDDIDASAITDYFAPLAKWLAVQNKGERCEAV
ncbi:M2 family metallopeptidase [Phenylobacterium montanum]|uniref:M2 family metallopeptidase n=2 Tax=Phenylobacterium montanum TaxID=2823693 RepID=A0A975G4S2_9CAUL|nr:M2 family metallopeptidase [Caulobacter sp. S6]QUD90784.1 M2 family metallopeptidase [Caulobacter sp. S6]